MTNPPRNAVPTAQAHSTRMVLGRDTGVQGAHADPGHSRGPDKAPFPQPSRQGGQASGRHISSAVQAIAPCSAGVDTAAGAQAAGLVGAHISHPTHTHMRHTHPTRCTRHTLYVIHTHTPHTSHATHHTCATRCTYHASRILHTLHITRCTRHTGVHTQRQPSYPELEPRGGCREGAARPHVLPRAPGPLLCSEISLPPRPTVLSIVSRTWCWPGDSCWRDPGWGWETPGGPAHHLDWFGAPRVALTCAER